MSSPAPSRSLRLWLPVLLFFPLYAAHSAIFGPWLIDDAGISFAYAHNLAHDHGWVAQPGLEAVEGFSNPLWTLLISPAFLLSSPNAFAAVKALSLVLVFFTFVLISRLNHELFGATYWRDAATSATLGFASVCTSYVVWTSSGLENALFGCLVILYCLLAIRYAMDPNRRTGKIAFFAGICATLLALTRPDGLAFAFAFPTVQVLLIWNGRTPWWAEKSRLLSFTGAWLVSLSIYIAFRYSYFGDIVPNTFHAKGGPTFERFVKFLAFSKGHMVNSFELLQSMFGWATWPVLAITLIEVLHIIARRRITSQAIYLLPFVLCAWAIYCLLPQDWMAEFRFATPFLLLFPMLVFALFAEIARSADVEPATAKIFYSLTLVGVLAIATPPFLNRTNQFVESPTISLRRVTEQVALKFNHYADKLNLVDASLLTPDLGGCLIYSKLQIHDLAGLCDRDFAPLMRTEKWALVADRVLEIQPTFVHVHGAWSLRSGLFDDPRFAQLYTPIQAQPSLWGRTRSLDHLFDGDYVLTSALSPTTDPTKWPQELIEEHTPLTMEQAVGFPRSQ